MTNITKVQESPSLMTFIPMNISIKELEGLWFFIKLTRYIMD